MPAAIAAAMPVGTVRQLEVPGCGALALYRLADGFYATDDRCTHGEASLADGDVDGDEIVCPFHLGRFDIRTGNATAAPCVTALTCHRIVADADGALIVEVATSR
ncbi:MAG: Rieske 2Fe-2S domain-containing protein [Gammaproteobacteria bacterium]